MKNELICDNLSVNAEGHLCLAGQDTTALAQKYGTPLYLLDEDRIRANCRMYKGAADAAFDGRFRLFYASKAASFKQIYRVMREEEMGVDLVSSGEIFTAKEAGFPLENALFHSNNKTDEDIAFAMDCEVGFFVADNEEELYAIEREAERRDARQKVLLRLTPGIDPHTFAAVTTGKVDSKFGTAIETGQAEQVTKIALSLPHVRLCGYHCHIGSQIFETDALLRAADTMLSFIARMKQTLGLVTEILDLGGGLGVRYTPEDPTIDIPAALAGLGLAMRRTALRLGIDLPVIALEPGRSIVADAGMTLYTVGTRKHIPGYRDYVSVDGGMTDNIRHALYGSRYTLLPADNMTAPRDLVCTVVGRCCESGDILQERVKLPSGIRRGDLLACLTTGAYHYSMASNYNRLPRPAVVMLAGGDSRVAVRRETPEDLTRLDV